MKGGIKMAIEWKKIEEFPHYYVSNDGHVKSIDRYVYTYNGHVWCRKHIPETILKEKNVRGYRTVQMVKYDENMRPIDKKERQIHRLVLITFKPTQNMEKLQVNHINHIRDDNRLENLEWVTSLQNAHHSIQAGRRRNSFVYNQNGEKNKQSKLLEKEVIEIIKELKLPKDKRRSITEIAKAYNVTYVTILMIKENKTWTYIDRSNI